MDKKLKTGATLAAAGIFAAALGLASTSNVAQAAGEFEKCFGIAKAGQNDCAATGNNSCAGTSKVDFDGGAWKLVKTGTCIGMETPHGLGSLEPIQGRPPA